jgi:hypothetical protein
MLHWICVHASGLMTTLGPLGLALDVVPCTDGDDLDRALCLWRMLRGHLHA